MRARYKAVTRPAAWEAEVSAVKVRREQATVFHGYPEPPEGFGDVLLSQEDGYPREHVSPEQNGPGDLPVAGLQGRGVVLLIAPHVGKLLIEDRPAFAAHRPVRVVLRDPSNGARDDPP